MIPLTHNEFQLSLPQGWEDSSHVIAKGPQQPDYQNSVVLVTEPLGANETLEEVMAKHMKTLQQFPGYQLVQQNSAQIGPYNGIFREHAFMMAEQRIGQMQFSFIYGKKVVTLTYSDLATRYEKSREQGMEIFKSLQLRATASDGFEKKQKKVELAPKADEQPVVTSNAPKIPVPRGPVKG